MKTCSKCRIEKDESEFSGDKQNKDGLCGQCIKCRCISLKIYRKNNPRKGRNSPETNRKYYEKQKQKGFPNSRTWRNKNKDKCLISSRKWVSNNREKRAEIDRRAGKKKLQSLPDNYVKNILIVQSYSKEEIEALPQLLEIKRAEIISYRLSKHSKI